MFRVVIRTGGRGFQIIDTILAFADEDFSSSAVTTRRRIVRRISEYRTNVVSSIEGKGSTAGVPQWIPGKSVEETCLAMEFRQVPNEGKAATSTDFYRELHSRGRRRMRASNINIFSFEPLKDAEHGNRIPTRLNLQEAAEVALRAEVSDLLTSWLVISTLYDSR
ncbi:hypothetical protein HZH66_001626 [Vespula vulgaris]|uniref:Uncharacterized protein n=1 Tax=Vespula vulgaris TaxID=7454 RepID=A0A834NKT9_VESVU|nr:hypothetical protein HZH66_001626 [Vespula vulgaris]